MKRALALIGRKRFKINLISLLAACIGGLLSYVLAGLAFHLFIVGAALACGLTAMGLSCFYVLMRHYMDDSINTPERLKDCTQAPVLSYIPHCTGGKSKDDASVNHLVSSYHTLRNNIAYSSRDGRMIALCSATASDGKTTVAINLAKTLVSSGYSVALVDADMRNPSLHRRMGLPNRSGLSNVLEHGEKAVFVRIRELPTLFVLCAGHRPEDPSDLLRGEEMSALLRTLCSRFDYVVIDAPPVLPVPDCAALAQHDPEIVFVARYGKTTMPAVRRAKNALEIANSKILGCVLNDIPAPICRSYGGRG